MSPVFHSWLTLCVGVTAACNARSVHSARPAATTNASAALTTSTHPGTSSVEKPSDGPPEPQSTNCELTDWPLSPAFSELLDEFSKENSDEKWAALAEEHLRIALAHDASSPFRKVECRRLGCVIGGFRTPAFTELTGKLVWSGTTRQVNITRRDGCVERVLVLWRHARDYAGAPGGRQSSMKPLRCQGGVELGAESCTYQVDNMCFKDAKAACACQCFRIPGVTKAECIEPVARGRGLGCGPEPHFGMKWP